jgi:hypothetical protein
VCVCACVPTDHKFARFLIYPTRIGPIHNTARNWQSNPIPSYSIRTTPCSGSSFKPTKGLSKLEVGTKHRSGSTLLKQSPPLSLRERLNARVHVPAQTWTSQHPPPGECTCVAGEVPWIICSTMWPSKTSRRESSLVGRDAMTALNRCYRSENAAQASARVPRKNVVMTLHYVRLVLSEAPRKMCQDLA